MIRIAVAGFQHETNTFSKKHTDYSQFIKPDNWPALLTQQEITKHLQGKNIPTSGFLSQANILDAEIIPLTWCSAPPAGKVTKAAFNTITKKIVTQINNLNQPIDAIYLDLHGAMVSETYHDADGEFVSRLRKIVGPDTWIIATLDFHANVSKLLFDTTDLLVAYKTYPHIDMATTGERAMQLLNYYYSAGIKPYKLYTKFDFLIPMTAQCTLIEPLKSIYKLITERESSSFNSISFTPGFPLADTPNTGPTLLCYSQNKNTCDHNQQQLRELIEQSKNIFNTDYIEQRDIINLVDNPLQSNPIILADTQDNPGCGGSGDTTGILRELLKLNTPCLVANIHDPETASVAFEANIGDKISIELGEKSPQSNQTPLKTIATVLHKTDQPCLGTGPFYQGCIIKLGLVARIKIENVEVIVTTNNVQLADISMIELTQTHPNKYSIVALKSSVHFRAAFSDYINSTHIVISPGINIAKLSNLDYQKLKKHIEILL